MTQNIKQGSLYKKFQNDQNRTRLYKIGTRFNLKHFQNDCFFIKWGASSRWSLSIPPHAKFGLSDHWQDASHFSFYLRNTSKFVESLDWLIEQTGKQCMPFQFFHSMKIEQNTC